MENLVINVPNSMSINSITAISQNPITTITYIYLDEVWQSTTPLILYPGANTITYNVNVTNTGSNVISLNSITPFPGIPTIRFNTIGGSEYINLNSILSNFVNISINLNDFDILTFNDVPASLYNETSATLNYTDTNNASGSIAVTGVNGVFSGVSSGNLYINNNGTTNFVNGTFSIHIIATSSYILISSFIFTPTTSISTTTSNPTFSSGSTANIIWLFTIQNTTTLPGYTLNFELQSEDSHE